jgi:hypothetical protein
MSNTEVLKIFCNFCVYEGELWKVSPFTFHLDGETPYSTSAVMKEGVYLTFIPVLSTLTIVPVAQNRGINKIKLTKQE